MGGQACSSQILWFRETSKSVSVIYSPFKKDSGDIQMYAIMVAPACSIGAISVMLCSRIRLSAFPVVSVIHIALHTLDKSLIVLTKKTKVSQRAFQVKGKGAGKFNTGRDSQWDIQFIAKL